MRYVSLIFLVYILLICGCDLSGGNVKMVSDKATGMPAFPGAEGAGMYAIGGRGGRVIGVTNLNDSGPGSFRAAVEATGPRIIVFRVSGTIEMQSELNLTNPCITIAGQTAPGGGICLKNYRFRLAADEVIVRHIRVRPGHVAAEKSGVSGADVDSIDVVAGRNIIIDHCSASWSLDEVLSVTENPKRGLLDDVTIQWCMITESLNCSIHPKGCHGYGSLIHGAWGSQYTFHHNLYAHHLDRSPRPGNGHSVNADRKGWVFDFRNNVVYNWGEVGAGYNMDSVTSPPSVTKMNFINNYYVQGPNSAGDKAFREYCAASKAYFGGNWMNGVCPKEQWNLVVFLNNLSEQQIRDYKQLKPFRAVFVTTDNAVTAYKRVLADAGATLPRRDAVDSRIVNEVTSGTGKIINDEEEVGGWPVLESTSPPVDSDNDGMPDDWEAARGLDPRVDDSAKDRDGDGYTNVEEYINGLCSR
jgi:pectate lyase